MNKQTIMNQQIQETFYPENHLEEVLLDAKDSRIPLSKFLKVLLSGQIFVLSIAEIKQDGHGLIPLIFNRNGIPMAAVFTAQSRTKPLTEHAQFLIEMAGKAFFFRIPEGYGVAINPKGPVGLDITPDGVREIVRDFITQAEPPM